jgi:hypothetical protein
MSNDGTQRENRRSAMESFGDAIVVAETTARPGMNPTARWYAQRWEEPCEKAPPSASPHRIRRAVARGLFALARALAVPGQQETASV